MTARDRVLLGVLVLDAVLLAVLELLFLPLWLGTVQFPITAAVAAVTTPLLVAEAARLSRSRLVAAAPLLAWLVAMFVFGVLGPGGDIVLIGDWRALLLIGGGALPGAMMLGIQLGKRGI
ncbi:hypothetical protein IQ251_14550 [Saccharopolyspora sp. HNM0983]|uniref:Uncharacterized protein n=1 Tax=Saccharopolyspora montiporae TaxID=2781240 RepID=A0A929BC64_9PSEU|nr:hypothetical protein [Saccharopolyspora sp. HNM0983]MBE9375670.1 hypothetical protein [Saccharopolyspora sp. HNM0983]